MNTAFLGMRSIPTSCAFAQCTFFPEPGEYCQGKINPHPSPLITSQRTPPPLPRPSIPPSSDSALQLNGPDDAERQCSCFGSRGFDINGNADANVQPERHTSESGMV